MPWKAFCLLSALLLTAAGRAQPSRMQGVMPSGGFIAGGGISGTAAFRLTSVYGLAAPVGMQTGGGFVLYGGVLAPRFGPALRAIDSLVIGTEPPDLYLYWEAVPGAVAYRVYRSAEPDFLPSPATLIATVAETFYADHESAGEHGYYVVTAVNTGGRALSVGRTRFP